MADDKDSKDKPEKPKKDEAAKDEPTKEAPSKKGKKDEKEKSKKEDKREIKISKKDLNLKPDFRYVVRIANTDIDGTRVVPLGLTKIDGIGIRVAEATVHQLGLPMNELLGNLNEEQIASLETAIQGISASLPPWMLNRPNDYETGQNRHMFGTEVNLKLRDDINLMKMIRCYKGIRHEDGQKVRGQRTRSNGRTGLTMGVTKKAALAAQAATKEGEKSSGGAEKKETKAAPAAAPAAKKEAAPAK